MKKKLIEKTPAIQTKKGGWWITVQQVEDILVLNVHKDTVLEARHCINIKNYDFATFKNGKWTAQRVESALDIEPNYYYYYYSDSEVEQRFQMSKEDEQLIKTLLKGDELLYYNSSAYEVLDRRERERGRDMRKRTENNRIARVETLMNKIPALPEEIKEWIYARAAENADYAFYDKKCEKWGCTACGMQYSEKELRRVDGEKKIRHNDMVVCPHCKKVIQVKKRSKKQELITHFMILQPVDEKMSVARHFDVDIYWSGTVRSIEMSESMRIMINKLSGKPKYACDIYYNQNPCGYREYFDNKSNPSHKSTYEGYLYEEGIEEALRDTVYESWTRIFTQMAAVGEKVQYNRLMATQKDESLQRVIECLFKGHFTRLLRETANNVSYWSSTYAGPLHISGSTIEEVFDIADRQKINRIRDIDGGEEVLRWMRWSDKTGEKISQEALNWLTQSNISRKDIEFIEKRMSVEKIMNYVKRQQLESYKGKTAKSILGQWQDYMQMCEQLKKHMDDEMVYKPRELKRRHDEAVAEIELRNAKLEADEYSRRFPGVEDVLQEIKPKYEYENETYQIIVPERLVEIVAEGRALHHCAGATDRYFDRIAQRETYICFLRKIDEPKVPYYTIEVEPGGTIRQHRGYLDEEPEIEKVKPFLREWQKEIKKRMSKADHEYAKVSAVKRQENIEELRAKNNTRVLQGLMEDFMEAI